MEAADTFGIGGLCSAIRTMDEYQFDPVEDQSHYGLRISGQICRRTLTYLRCPVSISMTSA